MQWLCNLESASCLPVSDWYALHNCCRVGCVLWWHFEPPIGCNEIGVQPWLRMMAAKKVRTVYSEPAVV